MGAGRFRRASGLPAISLSALRDDSGGAGDVGMGEGASVAESLVLGAGGFGAGRGDRAHGACLRAVPARDFAGRLPDDGFGSRGEILEAVLRSHARYRARAAGADSRILGCAVSGKKSLRRKKGVGACACGAGRRSVYVAVRAVKRGFRRVCAGALSLRGMSVDPGYDSSLGEARRQSEFRAVEDGACAVGHQSGDSGGRNRGANAAVVGHALLPTLVSLWLVSDVVPETRSVCAGRVPDVWGFTRGIRVAQ